MLSGKITLDSVVTLTELIGKWFINETNEQGKWAVNIWRVPTDLDDVSKYPNLFAELLRRGWSETDLEKLAGRNMLRVMRRVEQVQ